MDSGREGSTDRDDTPEPGPTADTEGDGDRRTLRALLPETVPLPGRLARTDAVVVAVALVALLALALRLYGLGYRTAHWDEARVAHWALRYDETGSFVYRHIVHGPLAQHAARFLFGLFGPSDLLARLPVALVGGLLPLSALLFREHLRDEEMVPLAVFLAGNSVLLYYSRFMRSDVLVGAFVFTAFGFLVRYYDTRRARYLWGGAAWFALGVASKENAILYVLTWLGGSALLIDAALFRPRQRANGLDLLRGKVGAVRERGLVRTGGLFVGKVGVAVAVFGVVWLYFFAPRGSPTEVYPLVSQAEIGTVTFGEALRNPLQFPTLLANTAEYFGTEYFSWFGTAGGKDFVGKYQEFAPKYLDVLVTHALPVLSMAVIGFLAERYARDRSRNLVLFFAYGGFVSVLAYPLALDVTGSWAWNATHSIIPLAVPAAVGVGMILRWGWAGLDGDAVTTALSVLLVVLLVSNLAVTSFGAVYDSPRTDENKLTQFAQPAGDFRATTDDIHRLAAENNGTDAVIYGDSFVGNEPSETRRPACVGDSGWFSSLPIPWYLYASDANTTCAEDSFDLNDKLTEGETPPIVVTKVQNRDTVARYVPDYDVRVGLIRTRGVEVAIFVDTDRLDG
ncbi:TIGR03663 family protein [Halapricum sp. CBA1109]|uniref:flippase activity-associated protein Agl23 n=1 Tax=Halapricum sp. CBA1109 TaxID=2668068 RepID=UPI0012F7680C|nr:flippase activity-associated protein Agl23 [Halapricum sp. CBA1109]MUV88703.1 TIGR03663 family protein [Halapricum sp. CBA1109]